MKQILFILLTMLAVAGTNAQSPVGKWKKVSHVSEYAGQKFDSHKALLEQRPCTARIAWEINADGTFRQNLSTSGCDENYKNMQTKLYSKTTWKLTGNKLFIGGKEGLGNTYTVKFTGNQMILTGTEGQGVITYQRL